MPKKYLKKLDVKLVRGEYKNIIKGQVREPEQIYTVFKKQAHCMACQGNSQDRTGPYWYWE